MPNLRDCVIDVVKDNIQKISSFFRWIHHSGEFIELNFDEYGLYSIRGIDKIKVRVYEMSIGQRNSIALSVMFALFSSAPNVPNFILLDEPLANMDDIQLLNVIDILKAFATSGTQIFFTTASNSLASLFREQFRRSEIDLKEFEFIKRVNGAVYIDEK